jgi:N-methylhydantoinase B/oxoprolinase/acetone carboxylase alpha subunit
MMQEFKLNDLNAISEFILENSRRATLERIAALPRTSADGELTVDGFDTPITLKVNVAVHSDRIVCDFTHSPIHVALHPCIILKSLLFCLRHGCAVQFICVFC